MTMTAQEQAAFVERELAAYRRTEAARDARGAFWQEMGRRSAEHRGVPGSTRPEPRAAPAPAAPALDVAALTQEVAEDLRRLKRLVAGLADRADPGSARPGAGRARLAPLVRWAVPFTVKAVTERGTFEGLASVYGVEDLQGDVVVRGAFARSLAERPKVPLLWQHDSARPVGLADLEDRADGLLARGTLVLEDPQAAAAAAHLRAGSISGLSIGYRVVEAEDALVGGRAVRQLRDVDLWEISLVTFPANPAARILDAREADPDDFAASVSARVDRLCAMLGRLAA